jgi:hypothetical protein
LGGGFQVDKNEQGYRVDRVFGGRASRLEVYLLAALLFVIAAGGVGGAIVVASNDSAENATVLPSEEILESATNTLPTTTPLESPTTLPPTTLPPTTQPSTRSLQPQTAQDASQLSSAEVAELQRQAQEALAEQARRDEYLNPLRIEGCGTPPYPQTQSGWDGVPINTSGDKSMYYTGPALHGDLERLGHEISRVAGLGCVSVGLGEAREGDYKTISWGNEGLFTREQVAIAIRKLGATPIPNPPCHPLCF